MLTKWKALGKRPILHVLCAQHNFFLKKIRKEKEKIKRTVLNKISESKNIFMKSCKRYYDIMKSDCNKICK